MAVEKKVYKCEVCGNIVEVLHSGEGELVCCGKPMIQLEEKTAESSVEKHVPFVQRTSEGYLVKVGENQEHPMTEEHFIEWIELTADGVVHRKKLNQGDKPEALFKIPEAVKASAREYCNLHGLWKN